MKLQWSVFNALKAQFTIHKKSRVLVNLKIPFLMTFKIFNVFHVNLELTFNKINVTVNLSLKYSIFTLKPAFLNVIQNKIFSY